MTRRPTDVKPFIGLTTSMLAAIDTCLFALHSNAMTTVNLGSNPLVCFDRIKSVDLFLKFATSNLSKSARDNDWVVHDASPHSLGRALAEHFDSVVRAARRKESVTLITPCTQLISH